MKTNIKLQISLPRQTRYLNLIGIISEKLTRQALQTLFNRDTLAQNLNVVLTEVMVNIIKHGYKCANNGNVKISIAIVKNELIIRFDDGGQSFDLNSIQKLNFDSDLLRECGRGILIIKTIMDSVVYKNINGVNILEMRKIII